MTFTIAELAARVGGEVQGDRALRVEGVAPLDEAGPSHISFFSNKKYRRAFEATRAGAVIVDREESGGGRTVLRVPSTYLAFAKISTLFHPARQAVPGIAAGASVHPSAKVDQGAQVMALASVDAGASVGTRTILFPGVHVGEGARIGEDCILYPNVVVSDHCVVGDRVILQPGCVIGADGFGYAHDSVGEGQGPRHWKIPQVGTVVIEDDVEIGANSCVDRATLGVTRIGRGAKIDDLVMVAHNVEIGPLSVLASQVGVSGSTKLGMGVVAWGQAGIVGHLTIGDRANIAAQSGVTKDVEAGARVAGSPAGPDVEWARNATVFNRLSDMRRELRELRREVEALRAQRQAEGLGPSAGRTA